MSTTELTAKIAALREWEEIANEAAAEVEALKAKFVEEGGVAEEFVTPADSDEVRLKEL